MTERFKIHITSDDAISVAKVLDSAGIPHFGPSFAKFVGADGAWTPGNDVTAVVEAENETAAGRRVRQLVGREPDVVAARPTDAPYDPSAEF